MVLALMELSVRPGLHANRAVGGAGVWRESRREPQHIREPAPREHVGYVPLPAGQ